MFLRTHNSLLKLNKQVASRSFSVMGTNSTKQDSFKVSLPIWFFEFNFLVFLRIYYQINLFRVKAKLEITQLLTTHMMQSLLELEVLDLE